jgi:hypothetical protein
MCKGEVDAWCKPTPPGKGSLDDGALTDLVYGVAEGRLTKPDAAVFLAAGLSRSR